MISSILNKLLSSVPLQRDRSRAIYGNKAIYMFALLFQSTNCSRLQRVIVASAAGNLPKALPKTMNEIYDAVTSRASREIYGSFKINCKIDRSIFHDGNFEQNCGTRRAVQEVVAKLFKSSLFDINYAS